MPEGGYPMPPAPSAPSAPSQEVDLSTVTVVQSSAGFVENVISNVRVGTVLGLGQLDLADYAAIEVLYCSDVNAKLGDKGSFFAISSATDSIRDPAGHAGVLSTGNMTNAAGAWRENIRTATVDLSQISYEGEIYLASYIGDDNSVTITGIRLIPA